jgi:hypothetical protein
MNYDLYALLQRHGVEWPQLVTVELQWVIALLRARMRACVHRFLDFPESVFTLQTLKKIYEAQHELGIPWRLVSEKLIVTSHSRNYSCFAELGLQRPSQSFRISSENSVSSPSLPCVLHVLHLILLHLIKIIKSGDEYKPITVAAGSKAWTVFACSNTEAVGSNRTPRIDVRVHLFCVCIVLYVVADPPSKEFYRLCIWLWN